MQLDVALSLPRDTLTVGFVRDVVGHALDDLGVTARCRDDCRLAISEGCSNVIEHATVDDDYEVHVHVDDERCVLRVNNRGDGFDATSLEGVMPSAATASGRGVLIMRAVMDHVVFASEPETGAMVRLVKNLEFDSAGLLNRLRERGPADRPLT